MTSNTTVNGVGEYYSWDVTSYTQPQFDGDKILSVVVKFPLDDPDQDNPNVHRDFASKEYNGTSYDPYLEITHTPVVKYYLTVISPYGTPGGEGWYDNCTNAYATLNTGVVDHGNGTRRVFTHWSGDASGNTTTSDPIHMDQNKTAIANWKTRYYLTLTTSPPSVTTPIGQGWYDDGTYASISTDEFVDIVPGASRYSFSNWTTGDISEIANASSPSTMVLMDKAKTVTANYVTQYYLTVKTDPSGLSPQPDGEGWYNASTDVDLTAPDPNYLNSIEYDFSYWDLDGTSQGIGVNPISVHIDTNHTATAHYTGPPPKYYLTVKTAPEGIETIPGEDWYDNCTYATLTAPEFVPDEAGVEGERYSFDHWTIDGNTVSGNPITVHMNANHTATAHYILQYYLTVASTYDSPTPTSGWFEAEKSITASVTSPVSGPSGTRYVCTGWTGTGSVPTHGTTTSVNFTINAPSSITWNWKTQYLLTVRTDPSGLSPQPTRSPAGEAGLGGWWYDSTTSVQLTAQPVTNYDFLDWDVDTNPVSGNPITVPMDGPHTATAHYQRKEAPPPVGGYALPINIDVDASNSLVTQIGLASVLPAAMAVAIILTRRRKKILKREH